MFKGLDINTIPIEKIIELGDKELAIKVNNPRFGLHEFHGPHFHSHIESFYESDLDEYDEESVIIFPLIPQYFHNMYEVFIKILKLKESGEKFKVIFLFDANATKSNGIFDFMLRKEDGAPNAAHIYDFFKHINDVEFVCYDMVEFLNIKIKSAYLYFDSAPYGYDKKEDKYDDIIYFYNNKNFEINHFLKTPSQELFAENSQVLRNAFLKNDVISGKKIYISRLLANDRKFIKEKELESFVRDIGYEVVFLEHMTMPDQIKMVQQSEKIICLYGSALVNCCTFCTSENSILSINTTENYTVDIYHLNASQFNIPFVKHDINNNDNIEEFENLKQFIVEWDLIK
jgi:hypothetical protein